MDSFRRRYYSGWSEFWKDFWYLISHRAAIRQAVRSNQISKAFRERLMLVVTDVNECRYCQSFHVPQAVNAGVGQEELEQLLSGLIPENTPDDQAMALVYARHWAERNAQPEDALEKQLLESYGKETVQEIKIILRMIRMGNLMGNTWDYLLYRLSAGRWGNRQSSSRR